MLGKIIQLFQNSRNITEKRKITSLINRIADYGYKSDQVYASFGEDAAAIRCNKDSEELMLITTDAILPEFVQNSPYGAGFSSIYVGIDDIMACGGKPLACSTILSYPQDYMGKEIFRGILDATHVFQIPLVRGHTTTDAKTIALSSTIVGRTTTKHFLSAGGANVGDILVIIWDQDGKPATANPNYWNTILMKSSEEFYNKRTFLAPCITKGYFHACKDISNGGILGTLYQMLEYSKKGAYINLDPLEECLLRDKFQYSLEDFLFLYLTSGFLVSCSSTALDEIMKYVKLSKMQCYPLGTVTKTHEIILKYRDEEKTMISIIKKNYNTEKGKK